MFAAIFELDEDVKSILQNHKDFINHILPTKKSPFFALMDGDEHLRIRNVVSKIFSTKKPLIPFDQIDKNSKIDVIKFNCSNEIAVNLFKFNKIKYNQIHQFIDNSLSLDFNNQVNSINDIVEFQQYFKEIVLQKNEII